MYICNFFFSFVLLFGIILMIILFYALIYCFNSKTRKNNKCVNCSSENCLFKNLNNDSK